MPNSSSRSASLITWFCKLLYISSKSVITDTTVNPILFRNELMMVNSRDLDQSARNLLVRTWGAMSLLSCLRISDNCCPIVKQCRVSSHTSSHIPLDYYLVWVTEAKLEQICFTWVNVQQRTRLRSSGHQVKSEPHFRNVDAYCEITDVSKLDMDDSSGRQRGGNWRVRP